MKIYDTYSKIILKGTKRSSYQSLFYIFCHAILYLRNLKNSCETQKKKH